LLPAIDRVNDNAMIYVGKWGRNRSICREGDRAMPLNEIQTLLCEQNKTDFSDLKAVVFNCTLKKQAEESHTRLLLSVAEEIMKKNGVVVEHVHGASHRIAYGVYPDMTEYGWDRDDWPTLWKKFEEADIVIIGTPIWLGEESSVCRILIERLYAMSGMLNDRGQSIFYGKVGGAVITGNEDGVKHCAMTILYALQHLGFVIPPQADCGWIGEAGPGPSYGDEIGDARIGFENDFTQRNTTIMTWNLMHLARMLKEAGGIANHGNDRRAWKAGCRFDYENPDYRA
jgi:multimeric flavodoxin WrbA